MHLSEFELTIFYLQIAILAIGARMAGEAANRLRLPAVVGEIFVGIILGPTIFRHFLPALQLTLFPPAGPNHIALVAVSTLGVSLFLLTAGMEIDLPLVRREGHVALPVSIGGIVLPFALGFAPAFLFPQLLGGHESTHQIIFALFVGAALSITSLPILAKLLIELGLYKTGFGTRVISAAVFDDVVGWTVAGFVFSLDRLNDAGNLSISPVITMVVLTLTFVGLMLTVGRWLCNRILLLIYRTSTDSAAAIGFIIGLAALGACLTQSIGMHGLFGAFIVGVVIGGSPHLRSDTRKTIEDFVSNFMAPLYFACVGLSVNFITNFDWQIVAAIVTIASVGKIVGCYSVASWNGLSRQSSIATGVAMNSRGSIEIVLGMIALQAKIIDERLFVALAIMSLITCSSTGYFLKSMSGALRKEEPSVTST